MSYGVKEAMPSAHIYRGRESSAREQCTKQPGLETTKRERRGWLNMSKVESAFGTLRW